MAYTNGSGQTRVGVRVPGVSPVITASTLLTSLYSVWNGETTGTSLDSSIFGAWNGDVQYSSTTLSNSLISAWNANSDTTDSVGTNNGTAVGGLTYTTGKIGNAFQFNGTDSLVSIPNTSGQFNFTGNFTINAWINIPNYSNYNMIFRNYVAGGSYGYGFIFYLATNNVFSLELRNGNNYSQYITNGGIATGSYKMITLVREVGLAPKIYIDGVLNSGSYYVNGNAATNAPGYQSNQVYSIGLGSNHKQDGTSIWNRTLTQAEITQLYSGAEYPYVPSTNDALGTNNGTAMGGLTYTTGKIGQAFQFNGTNAYVELPDNSLNFTGDFSASVWVYLPTNSSSNIGIFGNYNFATGTGWGISSNSTGNLYVRIGNTGGNYSASATSKVTINAWTHLVMVFKKGTGFYAYANSELVAQFTLANNANAGTTPTYSATQKAYIGLMNYSGDWWRMPNGGRIDSANVWQKALSIDEITQLYNSGTGVQYPYSSQTLSSASNQFGVDNGTLVNGCSLTTGKVGQAFTFDGVNDYVQLPNNSLNLTGDFSISMWVYLTSFPGEQSPISNYYEPSPSSGGSKGWMIYISGTSLYWIVCGSSQVNLITSVSSFQNTWKQITITFKNGVGSKIYFDGSLVTSNSSTITPIYNSTQTPFIGKYQYGDGSSFGYMSSNSKVDAVNVWQKALTQAEVTELYNSGNGKQLTIDTKIVTSGLVLNLDPSRSSSYPGTGTVWTDLSGQNNNGTLVNGVGYSSVNGGTLTFDGVNDYVNMGNIFNFGTGDFTYEVVVLYNNLTSNASGATIGKDNYSGTNTYKGVLINISDGINFETRNIINGSGPDNKVKYPQSNLSTNTWYIVNGIRNNNVLQLYVNGILRNSTTESTPTDITNSQSLRIGSLSDSSSQNLNGKIGLVRTYNRALSDSEVLQNFNATKSRFGL